MIELIYEFLSMYTRLGARCISHSDAMPNEKLNLRVRASEFFEVPLAQEDSVTAAVSQTQVLERYSEECVSQTQVLERTPLIRTPAIDARIPFMATPLVVAPAEGTEAPGDFTGLEPVQEGDEEGEEEWREYEPSKPRVRNRFIEDEAEGSEDGSHGDSDENSDDGDLSDLIASSPEPSQSQGGHARLHARWLQEQEAKSFQRPKEEEHERREKRRKKVRFPVQLMNISKVDSRMKKNKKKPKHELVQTKKENTKPNLVKSVVARAKRFPHRRSSVSSACSELEVRIGTQVLNRRPRPSVVGTFAFIEAPDKSKLHKAAASVSAQEDATAKAMAGASRLMGSKRFVFGNTGNSTT
jgi:hypothetical protein